MAKSSIRNTLFTLWLSPWTGWLGLRYLKSKKNSQFLSFISTISVLGVGLGVTAMVVVLSVMDGFEGELKKRLFSSDLHVLVTPKPGSALFPFVKKEAIEPTLEANLKSMPGVTDFWPVIATEAVLKTGTKVTGIVLKGVTAERLKRLNETMVETAAPQMMVNRQGNENIKLPGVFVGQELAYELGIIPGDQVTLLSPTETEGPTGGVPRLKRFAVEGIYHNGLPEQEAHTVFATDANVRSYLRKAGVVTQWEVTLSGLERVEKVTQEFTKLLPEFKVQGWREMNAHLFASLKLERTAMFVLLAFIVVVASFNISTTLTLMVIEKKREIAILRTMGALPSHISAVFLSEGLFIGGTGCISGLFLGGLLCFILKRYEFIALPDVFYDRTLPVNVRPEYFVIVGLSTLLIVLVACLSPAKRSAKLRPLDGIRNG